MSNTIGGLKLKIEPGQILDPDSFPPPKELVCVQVKKVFDQVSLRDCVTRDVVLTPCPGACCSRFVFEKADNFNIIEVKVLSKTDSRTRPGLKKLKLSVKIGYNIFYSDGLNQLKQPDEVKFNLTVKDIYCPSCSVQTAAVHHQNDNSCHPNIVLDKGGMFITVDALAEELNNMICSCTGALILQIGAFFVVKCECDVQLLIPSYGCCPVPAEQENVALRSCTTFKDIAKTPFPSHFFTEQKRNPLDQK